MEAANVVAAPGLAGSRTNSTIIDGLASRHSASERVNNSVHRVGDFVSKLASSTISLMT